MKPIRHYGWKFLAYPLSTLVNRRYVIVLIGLLSLLMVSTAYAGATFGSFTGPRWLGNGYEFTIDVTSMSTPHQDVCLTFSVNGGKNEYVHCTCALPDCDPTSHIGTWLCSFLTNYTNSTINFDISAYSGGSCTGNQIVGRSGTFTTSPTALGLTSFTTENAKASFFSSNSILLVAFGGVVVLLTLFWRFKSRKIG